MGGSIYQKILFAPSGTLRRAYDHSMAEMIPFRVNYLNVRFGEVHCLAPRYQAYECAVQCAVLTELNVSTRVELRTNAKTDREK